MRSKGNTKPPQSQEPGTCPGSSPRAREPREGSPARRINPLGSEGSFAWLRTYHIASPRASARSRGPHRRGHHLSHGHRNDPGVAPARPAGIHGACSPQTQLLLSPVQPAPLSATRGPGRLCPARDARALCAGLCPAHAGAVGDRPQPGSRRRPDPGRAARLLDSRRHAPHIQNFPRYYAAMLRGLVTQHCKRLQREQQRLRPWEEAGPC